MTLVDSNVLIDVIVRDARWGMWSVQRLDDARRSGGLWVNAIVYAEISAGLPSSEAVDVFLTQAHVQVGGLTPPVLWMAGQVHGRYRQAGGPRERVLPDFIIGAHAQELGCPLLTRDPRRYRSYFPDVRLITP